MLKMLSATCYVIYIFLQHCCVESFRETSPYSTFGVSCFPEPVTAFDIKKKCFLYFKDTVLDVAVKLNSGLYHSRVFFRVDN